MPVLKAYANYNLTSPTSALTVYTVPSGKVAQLKINRFCSSIETGTTSNIYMGIGDYTVTTSDYNIKLAKPGTSGDMVYMKTFITYVDGYGHLAGGQCDVYMAKKGSDGSNLVYGAGAEYRAGTGSGSGRNIYFGDIWLAAGEKITIIADNGNHKVQYGILAIEEDAS
tara:strand:- start:381 stop:884 length:504 start_codon:yes stop_codon:yes gene_type:complete